MSQNNNVFEALGGKSMHHNDDVKPEVKESDWIIDLDNLIGWVTHNRIYISVSDKEPLQKLKTMRELGNFSEKTLYEAEAAWFAKQKTQV